MKVRAASEEFYGTGQSANNARLLRKVDPPPSFFLPSAPAPAPRGYAGVTKPATSMKYLLSFALLLGTLTACETETSLEDNQVPAAVMSAFKAAYPSATDVEWEMEGDTYEVEYKINGEEFENEYSATGELLEAEEE